MTPIFADNSLMINSIEKENREVNLGIRRVVEIIFFSAQYVVLYKLRLDGILTCFWCFSLNQSPSEPNDINKL